MTVGQPNGRRACVATAARSGAPDQSCKMQHPGPITVAVSSERPTPRMTRWRALLFRLLERAERNPGESLGIPSERVVEVETRVEM